MSASQQASLGASLASARNASFGDPDGWQRWHDPQVLPPGSPDSGTASIAVALIARDAEKTLGACLDSLRPYVRQIVVGVDELTTDKTAEVAQQHGADIIATIKVSDWHECEQHGRVLAQDFAAARQQSFKYLDKGVDWWMWIDADDRLIGGDKLAGHLARVDRNRVDAIWLAYNYAPLLGGKQSSTIFDRERLLNTRREWQWQFRVHEVVAPVGVSRPAYGRIDDVRIEHQEHLERSTDHAARNLLLLEIDAETNPDDARTIFYIGCQHFSMGNFPAAVHWYERLVQSGDQNPYQTWQAYVYLSQAYQSVGDVDGAFRAAFGALEVVPFHPEPYLRLAALYQATGEPDKAIYWSKLSRAEHVTDPPSFAFRNPLDVQFNGRVALANAYLSQNKLEDARAEFVAANEALPHPDVQKGIAECDRLIALARRGEAFGRVLSEYPAGDGRIALWRDLADKDLRSLKPLRDLVMPGFLKGRRGLTPRVVFFCGRSLEPWCDTTPQTTGIGGSETAVVEIAERFARDGWTVDVYNDARHLEGLYQDLMHTGIGYWDTDRFRGEPCDVLVSWRQPGLPAALRTGRVNLVWCHDLHYGPTANLSGWDVVLGVSAWHAHQLERYYPGLRSSFVPNGVDLSRFREVRKKPFSAIYASSPDRGLARLLSIWPRIVENEPGAVLRVAYGFENIDKLIANGRNDLRELKDDITKLLDKTPGVEWVGRVNQQKLADLYSESVIWAYPTDFLEVSCISAMEAMAGGCIPVTSAVGALPETIGSGGDVVTGNVYGPAWGALYANVARAHLAEANLQLVGAARARERSKALTWDAAYQNHWKPLIDAHLHKNGKVKESAGEEIRELAEPQAV